MKETVVNAVFIGLNNSCGFIHGQNYQLTLNINPDGSIHIENKILYRDPLKCTYQSLKALLNNWANITQLPEAGQNLNNKPHNVTIFDIVTDGVIFLKKIIAQINISQPKGVTALNVKINKPLPEYVLEALGETIAAIETVNKVRINYETRELLIVFKR